MKKRKPPKRMFRIRDIGADAIMLEPDRYGPDPHYLPLVREAARMLRPQVRPGQVLIMEVRHDDWCAVFSGGACNCNPDACVKGYG